MYILRLIFDYKGLEQTKTSFKIKELSDNTEMLQRDNYSINYGEVT